MLVDITVRDINRPATCTPHKATPIGRYGPVTRLGRPEVDSGERQTLSLREHSPETFKRVLVLFTRIVEKLEIYRPLSDLAERGDGKHTSRTHPPLPLYGCGTLKVRWVELEMKQPHAASLAYARD